MGLVDGGGWAALALLLVALVVDAWVFLEARAREADRRGPARPPGAGGTGLVGAPYSSILWNTVP